MIFVLTVGRRFIPLKHFIVARVESVVKTQVGFLATLTGSDPSSRELAALALENSRLKAQILFLSKEPREEETGGRGHLVAKIYSTYPFNNRGLVSVNAGERDGIRPGMPVTVDGYTFFGSVEEVAESWSSVRTVLDAGWELPVKVGSDSVDALLVGGREPKLTLIVKSGEVSEGDPVYLASREFPYGLKVGEVKGLRGELGSAFREAEVGILFRLYELTEVWILHR